MKATVAGRVGNHLEHAFDVDRLGASRIDDPLFPDSLQQRVETVLTVQFQEDICVKIHKYNRYGCSVPADPTVFPFQLLRCRQDALAPRNFADQIRKVPIFHNIGQGFLFCHHRDDAGIRSFAIAVGTRQHFHQPVNRRQHRKIEIEIEAEVDPAG